MQIEVLCADCVKYRRKLWINTGWTVTVFQGGVPLFNSVFLVIHFWQTSGV